MEGQNVIFTWLTSYSKCTVVLIKQGLDFEQKSVLCDPNAQSRFNEMLPNSELVWNKIYSLPFQVALDTKTRDFQYKILNRILFTNAKLSKLKLVESPLCSFCGKDEETPEHLCLLPIF